MTRSTLATIRLSKAEASAVKAYLRQNPVFDSLSSLGRVATMEFVRTKRALALDPISDVPHADRPRFLWDYDLSEAQVHELLQHAPFDQRKWLITRILERLRPPEVFQYLSLQDIRHALPRLRMDLAIQRHWQEALILWTEHPATS